jgi:hypothetical protein
MRSRSVIRVVVVGGVVVLMVVIASVVSAGMVPIAVGPMAPGVQPAPVPTSPRAQPSAAGVPGIVARRPAPVPVPTPPGIPAPPQGRDRVASTLALLGLSALASGALVVFRLRDGLPAERRALGARRVARACQERG